MLLLDLLEKSEWKNKFSNDILLKTVQEGHARILSILVENTKVPIQFHEVSDLIQGAVEKGHSGALATILRLAPRLPPEVPAKRFPPRFMPSIHRMHEWSFGNCQNVVGLSATCERRALQRSA